MIGALGAIGAIGSLIGAIGAGILGESVPVVPLLIVQGSGYVIGGLVVAWMTGTRRTAPMAEPG